MQTIGSGDRVQENPGNAEGFPSWFSGSVIRRGLLIVVPAFLALSVTMAVIVHQDSAAETAVHTIRSSQAVRSLADNVRDRIKLVGSDLILLANQAKLRSYLKDGVGLPGLREDYLQFSRAKRFYQQVRLIDELGDEQIRIDFDGVDFEKIPETELQKKAHRPYFRQTMNLDYGQIFVSRFDLNVEYRQIQEPRVAVIRLATPVVDESGRKRGILILNVLAQALLGHDISTSASTAAGPPAEEIFFVDPKGRILESYSSESPWGYYFSSDARFASSHPKAWNWIAGREQGETTIGDDLYSFVGLRLMGVGDPGSRLKIVAYVPKEVLHAGSTVLRKSLILALSFSLLALLVVGWVVGHALEIRRFQEREVARSEGRLRRLSREFMRDTEEDRRRIAQDLHDHLGSIVTAVQLDLKLVESASDMESRSTLIGRAEEGLGLVVAGIREMAFRVRPSTLDDLGLVDAVRTLAKRSEGASGIEIKTKLDLQSRELEQEVADNLYRIVEEALNNVNRHSKAGRVVIVISAEQTAIRLEVMDDGVGFVVEGVRRSQRSGESARTGTGR